MPQPTSVLRLGDQELDDSRHVCGLFDGPDQTRAAVLPFVVDGLRSGDRVLYLAEDPTAVRVALAREVDIAPLETSGHLDIRPWSATYLDGARFSGSRMLGLLRSTLRDGPGQGYTATRVVGEMEWAQDGVPGVDELIAYEAGVDAILGNPPNAVICAYDVRRHSASRIAATAAVHEAVFVGGRLQRTAQVSRGSTPRDRIIDAASRLFGTMGVRAAGVDSIIGSAGVAKATFYRHFPSKADLIVAWLEDPRTRWFDKVRGRAEALAESSIDLVPAFFRALADWLVAGDFRGCPYLNTAVELGDRNHPAAGPIRSYLREIEGYLGEIAAAAGCREPQRVGSELQVLAAGAITLGVAHRSTEFALIAADVGATLVAAAGGGQAGGA